MRILLLTQYFYPEVGAPQERLGYLATHLAQRGHKVTVLTTVPNYPLGRLYPGYKNPPLGLTVERNEAGIKILRTWVYLTKGRRSFAHRLANFLSFAFSALRAWGRVGQVDVVLVETPPIFLSFTGSLFAALRRARKVVYFVDPWVSFAIEHGYLRQDSLMAKLARWLERCSLQHSDLVVVPTPGVMATCLELHGLKRNHVDLVMNGVDVDFFRPDPDSRAQLRRHLGLEDKFVVVYAGTHSIQANLDVLVGLAKRLQKVDPDVMVLLIGDGVEKPRIGKLAREAGVLNHNLKMMAPVPAARIRKLLSACDVGASPLGPAPVTHKILTVKLLTYMACGLPVVVTDREIQGNIVSAAECGLTCPSEDKGAWAESTLWMRDNARKRREMGENGRRFVVENFSRKDLAYTMESLLVSVVKSGKSAWLTPPTAKGSTDK